MTTAPIGNTTIVLADDHPIVRKALVDLLAEEPDLETVAVCADGREALQAIEGHAPDIAILDQRMPEFSGIDVLARVHESGLATRVILLTGSIDQDTLLDAISMGLSGLFLKEALPEDLIRSIRRVAAGRPYLPDDILRAAQKRADERRELADDLFGELTDRQRQIAACVAEGLSNKAIARRLDISEGTVKIHLHHIYQKLNVHNRSSVAAMAVTHARYLFGEGAAHWPSGKSDGLGVS